MKVELDYMSHLRTMAALVLSVAVAATYARAQTVDRDNPQRFVKGRVLVSTKLPDIRVKLSKAFRYIGKLDFTIPDVAKGERYIFAETQGRKIKRLFIAQFEAILPESTVTYNYSFKDALTLGSHKFRQNTFAYSNRESKQENPQGEGALTADFLTKKGYVLEDELMMSRFVTVPDAERKHELILFYVENVSESGRRLQEFYEGDGEALIWQEVSRGLTKRSLENFAVLK